MPQKEPFVHKLIKKLDKLDKSAIEQYVLELCRESDVLTKAIQETNDGIVVIDLNNQIQFINDNALHWLGISTGQSLRHKKICDLISDQEVSGYLKEVLCDKTGDATRDIKVLVPSEKFFRMSLVPITCDGDNATVLVMQDIGHQKRQEIGRGELARIESLLRLAAGVAHEIGNPLNSIAIHIRLLRKEVEALRDSNKESIVDKLNVLESETQRLDRIVRNFLKATRKPPLRIKMEDLNSVVKDAAAFMQPEMKAKGIELKFSSAKSEVNFLMDRERIHEVVINLLKNSMEAMRGPGQVSIAVSYKDKVATLRVRDEGCGIPEENLAHIFDAYYTTKDDGSGLGLMAVFNGVNEHGGRVEVNSKPAKGTEFVLLFPMRRPNLQIADITDKGEE